MASVHITITEKPAYACSYNTSTGTQEILYTLAAICCSVVNKIWCTTLLYYISTLWPVAPANQNISGVFTLCFSAALDTSSIGTINKSLTGPRYLVMRMFSLLSLILTVLPLNVTVSLLLHNCGTDTNRIQTSLNLLHFFAASGRLLKLKMSSASEIMKSLLAHLNLIGSAVESCFSSVESLGSKLHDAPESTAAYHIICYLWIFIATPYLWITVIYTRSTLHNCRCRFNADLEVLKNTLNQPNNLRWYSRYWLVVLTCCFQHVCNSGTW